MCVCVDQLSTQVADGEALSIRTLTDALGGDTEKAISVLLLSKYWTTQASIASSDNTKVLFYPSKATVPISVEGLREMIGSE